MKNLIITWSLLSLLPLFVLAQHFDHGTEDQPLKILYNGFNPGEIIHLVCIVREHSPAGTVVFRELHKLSTDTFGNVSFYPGGGLIQLKRMPWMSNSRTPFFLQIEVLDSASKSFVVVGTTEQISREMYIELINFNYDIQIVLLK